MSDNETAGPGFALWNVHSLGVVPAPRGGAARPARRARPRGSGVSLGSDQHVPAFALGDYEWILPLEADDPLDLVDMMRTLRATRARSHVREEAPFFTGRRIELHELYELLGT
ncbi:chlorite dismutase family protein [Streptomyces sp. 150FB]|uniref:chlorite dismutase family protein n=1 Tax=Streptomyces sp. 150FB TaxID=1576605 RepID=UPI000B095E70|nr:chlorite dismutase family protein [Streptomyces sp. 150FB]